MSDQTTTKTAEVTRVVSQTPCYASSGVFDCILDQIKYAWNKQADKYNQWDSLGADEMLDFSIGFIRARFLTYIAASELLQTSPVDIVANRKYGEAKGRAISLLCVGDDLEDIDA